MTIPRLPRARTEPEEIPVATLDQFAAALAECGDPVKAGRTLGMGPMKATAVMIALKRSMGSQAR